TPELLATAQERLAAWRDAVMRDAGPDGTDVVARLRTHLADDLDTPGALAVVDAWAAEARAGRADDPTAPRLVRDAVDALLGVAL
ncbi:MAG: L-cysteine:1D-myo-inositol 2-amino-2-deoxy-alpha-D-glucopyranoside ligase, partial [Pseudonocardiales bacterium]|nr:L-cysteine:1D-myo-inositol 2-amino-2-deoxy-alpha-D-glucopyranoside ligase [Pseudonocardiales bacterium]